MKIPYSGAICTVVSGCWAITAYTEDLGGATGMYNVCKETVETEGPGKDNFGELWVVQHE